MNAYTELLRYIKQLGERDVFVKTITRGDTTEVDINKTDIFPLLHVDIVSSSFPSDGVIRFNVDVSCLNIRMLNKEINTDKFHDNDNEDDNFNETLAVLNRIWLLMLKDFEENDITAELTADLEKIKESEQNLLDGWRMNFDVDVPNTIISLCQ
jgi:hypothetical protein